VIDPLIALAFSVHREPWRVRAPARSGVSRAAGVPTGWDVVTDLIERVAHLQGEDMAGDPGSWFRARYKVEPSYSALLAGESKLAEPDRERPNIRPSRLDLLELVQRTLGLGVERRPPLRDLGRPLIDVLVDRLLERVLGRREAHRLARLPPLAVGQVRGRLPLARRAGVALALIPSSRVGAARPPSSPRGARPARGRGRRLGRRGS
jgi:hypothetical protein